MSEEYVANKLRLREDEWDMNRFMRCCDSGVLPYFPVCTSAIVLVFSALLFFYPYDLTCKQSSLHANKHNVPEQPGWRCDLVMYPCYFVLVADPWELKHATRKISPTNNQANIVELHPASVYSIRMYSYNKIGRSQASKELTISTEEARTYPDPDLASSTHHNAVQNLYLLHSVEHKIIF